MESPEAKALLGTLVAAFRPRDFGKPSELLYLQALEGFEFVDGQAAISALLRWTDYMPSLHGLVEEIVEQRDKRGGQKALPAPAWTDADEDEAKAFAEKWYAEHPFLPPPKTVRQTRVIEVDEADVERKRKAARRAAAKLRREQREKATESDGERSKTSEVPASTEGSPLAH